MDAQEQGMPARSPLSASWTFLACLILLAGAPLSGCGGKEARDPNAGGSGAQGAAGAARLARRVPVEVRPVEPRPVVYTIQAVGSLQAREVQRVPARVPGVVQDIRFQEGDHVTPDKVLARIDPERYRLAAARAEAAHQQAAAQAREAEAGYDKRQALRAKDPGWVTEEELTNFAAQLDAARAAEAAAKAALELAVKDSRDCEVRVDYPGIVDQKQVDTGQYVTAGTTLATLVDTRRLKLSFRVAESESVRLSPDTRVSFQVKALPGREFTARLFHVGEVADPGTRMVECLAWVENPGSALRPGFFADVTAEVEEKKASIVVPQTAVLPTERGFVAFVVTPERTVEERRVRLGLYTRDGGVEILDGLRDGEPLVVRGASLLSDGMGVEVQGQGPGAPAGPAGGAGAGAGGGSAPQAERL